ncbi:MAG: C40 family peptidase [Pseudomonadota bacterium]
MIKKLITAIFRISLLIIASVFIFACSHTPQDIEPQNVEEYSEPVVPLKKGQKIADLARAMLGSPYKYGGDSPSGFDCSGLVFYTHGELGIRTPRTSLQQFNTAKAITTTQLSSGDLVFFKLNKQDVSHVGIYIGQGRFVHAPKSGKRVSVNYLNDEYWKPRFAGAGRLY